MIAGSDTVADSDRPGWITSSFSSGSGSCVEVAFTCGTVLIRDSKDRRTGRPVIGLAAEGWTTFLATIIDSV
ncbi:MAG TPA: DUF397 domain-containing protein [Actinophytocola sp.]|uniref:DUF397 domain-containing protein n=1 Tax=Actinophytocola sp. TaxID=1872138 RepID=UPI002DDCC058|nr:DUF397 domain-containing protein [Actinophytocola sp.]HEV2780039.1 DUF397 domain-containing protein [Actinophytocola sp.]